MTFTVLLVTVNTLAMVPDDIKSWAAVKVCVFVLKVPDVSVHVHVVILHVSCRVSVPPGAFTVNDFAHVFVPQVRFEDHLPSYVYNSALPVSVIPEISVILPNMLHAVDVVHVGVFVAPVQFTPPIRGIS